MVTLNWLIHASDRSLAAFSEVLYEYSLTFVAALFVRTVVTNPLVGRLARAVVPAGLAGFRRTVAMTLVNVSVMVTFMTFFGVLISNGPAGFTWLAYAESLPLSYLLAFSVLFVGTFFRRMKGGLYIGAVVACAARFLVHFISGVTVYRIYAPTELFNTTFTNPWLYSLVYNGSYMLIDLALCAVILLLLQKPMKKFLVNVG